MDADHDRDSSHDAGTVTRMARAIELVASAHAARAKEEAGKDLSRIISGIVLLGLALFFVVPVVILLDAAGALYLTGHWQLTLPASLLTVAGVNVAIACVVALVARSRLAPPVMVETRATLKRAAIVLRG